jgi:hypothetical protein
MLRDKLSNNGHSTQLTRQSDLNGELTTVWKFQATEEITMPLSPQVSVQDGGNSGDLKVPSSPMIKERFLISQEELTPK